MGSRRGRRACQIAPVHRNPRTGPSRSLLYVSCLEFDAEFVRELPQVMPGGEVRLAEAHGDGRIRCELLKVEHALEDRFEERGLHRHFSNVEANNLVALADREDNPLKSDRPLARLLESFVGLGARVELATGARYEAARLHIVN